MAGNQPNAYALSQRLMRKGLIRKIRRNLYSAVNLLTNEVIASKYQIACAISETAYLCLYTAAELHGLVELECQEVQVSSESLFNNFKFQESSYKLVSHKINGGIVAKGPGIRTTDVERTLLDAANQPMSVGGIKTLVSIVERSPSLNESKLTDYLDAYNSRSLYQKVGFLLSTYTSGISSDFFHLCQERMGSGTRYFSQESRTDGVFDCRWQIVLPK